MIENLDEQLGAMVRCQIPDEIVDIEDGSWIYVTTKSGKEYCISIVECDQ